MTVTKGLSIQRLNTRRLAPVVATAIAIAMVAGAATSPLMLGALGATGAGLVGRGAYQLRHHRRAGH